MSELKQITLNQLEEYISNNIEFKIQCKNKNTYTKLREYAFKYVKGWESSIEHSNSNIKNYEFILHSKDVNTNNYKLYHITGSEYISFDIVELEIVSKTKYNQLIEYRQTIDMLREEYPERLCDAIVGFSNIPGFTVKKENDLYVFESGDHIYKLSYIPTEDQLLHTIDSIEYEIKYYNDKLKEQLRISNIRRDALNKLTTEEKTILGIS